jgi:hypothetical protein
LGGIPDTQWDVNLNNGSSLKRTMKELKECGEIFSENHKLKILPCLLYLNYS